MRRRGSGGILFSVSDACSQDLVVGTSWPLPPHLDRQSHSNRPAIAPLPPVARPDPQLPAGARYQTASSYRDFSFFLPHSTELSRPDRFVLRRGYRGSGSCPAGIALTSEGVSRVGSQYP